MEILVTRCEECPLFSRDIDDSEYCSTGGDPEKRYIRNIGRPENKIKDIPDNCPILKESVTVKLAI